MHCEHVRLHSDAHLYSYSAQHGVFLRWSTKTACQVPLYITGNSLLRLKCQLTCTPLATVHDSNLFRCFGYPLLSYATSSLCRRSRNYTRFVNAVLLHIYVNNTDISLTLRRNCSVLLQQKWAGGRLQQCTYITGLCNPFWFLLPSAQYLCRTGDQPALTIHALTETPPESCTSFSVTAYCLRYLTGRILLQVMTEKRCLITWGQLQIFCVDIGIYIGIDTGETNSKQKE